MKQITAVLHAHPGLPGTVIAACEAPAVARIRPGEHGDDAV